MWLFYNAVQPCPDKTTSSHPQRSLHLEDAVKISYPKTDRANKTLELRRWYLLVTNVTDLVSRNQQESARI